MDLVITVWHRTSGKAKWCGMTEASKSLYWPRFPTIQEIEEFVRLRRFSTMRQKISTIYWNSLDLRRLYVTYSTWGPRSAVSTLLTTDSVPLNPLQIQLSEDNSTSVHLVFLKTVSWPMCTPEKLMVVITWVRSLTLSVFPFLLATSARMLVTCTETSIT